ILSKMQPTMITTHTDKYEVDVKVDVSLNNITVPSDHSLTAIPLEKSQSDSKLNKADVASTSFTEKSPSTRRRANSGGAAKRSEKKSKKKSSKSTPKLSDSYTIQADGSNISVVVSEDSKTLPRNKSMDDIKASCIETDGLSPTSKSQLSTLKLFANASPNGSTGSLCKGPSPAFQAQHSMLEKCLRQYEIFYVKLISQRILSRERTVQDMFDHLVVSCPRKSFDERMRYLEHLLNSKLNIEDSGFFSQDTSVTEGTKCLDIFHLSLDITA
ncbi:PREDICTED: protein dopey-1 homolog, partial [Dinoponera quadriceps]|uniref:Protein dopey-1 homolog n=1 Tax=Dinoponera quadriceps TaxID=609295 RepID=A0A6P3YDG4_DINQU